MSAWAPSPTAIAAVSAAAAATALVTAIRTGAARRRSIAFGGASAGAVSLAVTVITRMIGGIEPRSAAGFVVLIEVAILLALTVVTARLPPIRRAVVGTGFTVTAVGLTVLRFNMGSGGETDPSSWDNGTIAGIIGWAGIALAAAALGAHLRTLDSRRVRSVHEAQRLQRLHLARDLHDFVAHDVSEMLAQAQAGQVLAGGDAGVAQAFERIEQAAQRALRSMDQTVQMLHEATLPESGEGSASAGSEGRTLLDLENLTRRFADANGTAVVLQIEPTITTEQLRGLRHEVTATLYRVAVEALTNVRRHAPRATGVTVVLRRASGDDRGQERLELTIADDATPATERGTDPVSRHNGLGLPTLRERLVRMGGDFTAGPRSPNGWLVRASVPWSEDDPAPGPRP